MLENVQHHNVVYASGRAMGVVMESRDGESAVRVQRDAFARRSVTGRFLHVAFLNEQKFK